MDDAEWIPPPPPPPAAASSPQPPHIGSLFDISLTSQDTSLVGVEGRALIIAGMMTLSSAILSELGREDEGVPIDDEVVDEGREDVGEEADDDDDDADDDARGGEALSGEEVEMTPMAVSSGKL